MRHLHAIGVILLSAVTPASSAARRSASSSHECWSAFDGVKTGAGNQSVSCIDGDPACDLDGAMDGRCTFNVRLCVNVRSVPGCRPRRLREVTVSVRDLPDIPGNPEVVLEPPPLRGHRAACGPVAGVVVPLTVRGSAGTARVRFATRIIKVRASTRRHHDPDKLKLRCRPGAGGYCFGAESGPARLAITVADPPAELPASIELCLTGCDGASNPSCRATAEPAGVRHFPPGGPPRPQVLGGVPVCVVEGSGRKGINVAANVATGVIEGTITRPSMLYLSGDMQHICPRCILNPFPSQGSSENVCDSGQNVNGPCAVAEVVTVEGQEYAVSRSCLPDGPTVLPLTTEVRLTTESSSGCGLGDPVDGMMGSSVVPLPPWPESTYPKLAPGASIAVSVCQPSTGDAALDAALGRPAATSAVHALDSEFLGPNQPGR